jgi:hypothetical protein
MTMYKAACVAICLAAATPAPAHHSYSMFDRSQSKTLTGSVRNFEMINPHSYVWIVVPTDHGDQIWGLEGGGVPAMQRAGLNKSSVKVGTAVIVDIYPLRDGRNGGQLIRLRLPDGTVIGRPIDLKDAQ